MRRRFEPEPVGVMLKAEFLDDYRMSAEEFAAATRCPLERVERVLAGIESLDADMALRLARLFGGAADGWLFWQQSRDLWLARERIAGDLDAIIPLDPDTRRSVREDEPLEPELIEELRRRLADVDDPRRWLVVSRILDQDVPLHERDAARTFYNVETNCYALEILVTTSFKNRQVAEATAAVLGDRMQVVEVTKDDLRKPVHDDEVDRQLRARVFKHAGQGMLAWDIGTYLRDKADMAAYLHAAAEDGDRDTIAVAVADVMTAMAESTAVEYPRDDDGTETCG